MLRFRELRCGKVGSKGHTAFFSKNIFSRANSSIDGLRPDFVDFVNPVFLRCFLQVFGGGIRGFSSVV